MPDRCFCHCRNSLIAHFLHWKFGIEKSIDSSLFVFRSSKELHQKRKKYVRLSVPMRSCLVKLILTKTLTTAVSYRLPLFDDLVWRPCTEDKNLNATRAKDIQKIFVNMLGHIFKQAKVRLLKSSPRCIKISKRLGQMFSEFFLRPSASILQTGWTIKHFWAIRGLSFRHQFPVSTFKSSNWFFCSLQLLEKVCHNSLGPL